MRISISMHLLRPLSHKEIHKINNFGVSFRHRVLGHFSDQIWTRPERYTLSVPTPRGSQIFWRRPRAEIVLTASVEPEERKARQVVSTMSGRSEKMRPAAIEIRDHFWTPRSFVEPSDPFWITSHSEFLAAP